MLLRLTIVRRRHPPSPGSTDRPSHHVGSGPCIRLLWWYRYPGAGREITHLLWWYNPGRRVLWVHLYVLHLRLRCESHRRRVQTV